MTPCFLAFTSTSYAYHETPEKAKQTLLNELKKNNIKPYRYAIADVTHIPNNVTIIHDTWFAETEFGEKIEIEIKKF